MQGESVGSVSCAAPQARGLRLPWQTGDPTLGCWGATTAATGRAARPAASRFGVLFAEWLSETLWQGGGAGGQGRAWGPGNLSLAALKDTLPHLRPPGGWISSPTPDPGFRGLHEAREGGVGGALLAGRVWRCPEAPFPHSPVPPLPLASVGNSDHRGPDAGVELARRESG